MKARTDPFGAGLTHTPRQNARPDGQVETGNTPERSTPIMHHPFQQWLTTLPDHALIPTHSGLLTVVMWAAQAGLPARCRLVTEAAHGVIAVEEEMWSRGLIPPPRPTTTTDEHIDDAPVKTYIAPLSTFRRADGLDPHRAARVFAGAA